MDWRDEDRGLAVGYLAFAAAIVAFALLYAITDPAAGQLFDAGTNISTSSRAQTAVDRRETIWTNLPLYVLGLVFVALIARATFESRL